MRAVLAIAAILAVVAPAGARAQDWPQRQVTIVVPFAAGGSADLLARILQQHMQAKFGVPFVVENKSGAGGSIGTGYVAKAPADGYTLLLGTLSGNVINGFLYSKLPYDVERDFEPVSLLVHLPNLLVVNAKISAKTVPELIAYLKANDGKVTYGSSGNGTSSHLSAVMFQLASGTKMTHVPFRSTADELNSMIGGHIDLAIDSMTTLWPQAQAGVGAGDCGHQRETRPERSRPADHRRDAARIFGLGMARPVRSGRNAAPRHRQGRGGGEADFRIAGGRDGAQKRRGRACPDDPRSVRGVHQGRTAEVEGGRQGLRRARRLIRPMARSWLGHG